MALVGLDQLIDRITDVRNYLKDIMVDNPYESILDYPFAIIEEILIDLENMLDE